MVCRSVVEKGCCVRRVGDHLHNDAICCCCVHQWADKGSLMPVHALGPLNMDELQTNTWACIHTPTIVGLRMFLQWQLEFCLFHVWLCSDSVCFWQSVYACESLLACNQKAVCGWCTPTRSSNYSSGFSLSRGQRVNLCPPPAYNVMSPVIVWLWSCPHFLFPASFVSSHCCFSFFSSSAPTYSNCQCWGQKTHHEPCFAHFYKRDKTLFWRKSIKDVKYS